MLDLDNAQEMIVSMWQQLGCRIKLPEEWIDAQNPQNDPKVQYNDRRRFVRFPASGKAILERSGKCSSIYVIDIARVGLGFLNAEQILPREKVRVWLPNGTMLSLAAR